MKITIGGARGSYPVCRPDYSEFGGETTSFFLKGQLGEQLIVDAGTGIKAFASMLARDRRLAIFFSHYHLDHVNGLLSFEPLYDAEWPLELMGPVIGSKSIEDVLALLVNEPLWPIPASDISTGVKCTPLLDTSGESGSSYEGFTIHWCRMHHFAGSFAFRITEKAFGKTVVIATDVEWKKASNDERRLFYELCQLGGRRPDLLIFDGHFTNDEYSEKAGWGHSTVEDALELASQVEAGRLLIAHHDPHKNDGELRKVESIIRAASDTASLARQGVTIEV